MIVVRLDLGAVQRPRRDRQAVGELLDVGADAAQLRGEGGEAVGFLVANVGDVANGGRPLGETGDGGRAS